MAAHGTERVETLVVGGGQAGLAVGYHLTRGGRDFRILDANERVGDSWRKRWPSLRLYSPAAFDALPGMRFPAPRYSYPTGLDMAAYLEAALEEEDPAVFSAALGDIARAKGMTEIARVTGLGRESLYKALSPEGNPEFATILKVIHSLGLKLHATPL